MKKYLLTAFAAIVLLTGCNSVAITGRKQLNLVDDSQVLATSLTSYKEIISKSRPSEIPGKVLALLEDRGIARCLTNMERPIM